MITIEYRYNFPKHMNNGLFSNQHQYNFFIFASGYTRLGTAEEFMTDYPRNDAICTNIPMGSKALVLMERETIVNFLGIRWHNVRLFKPKTTIAPFISRRVYGKYLLIMDNGEQIRCEETSYTLGEWPDYKTALSKAMEVAKKERREILIAKLYSWDNWH